METSLHRQLKELYAGSVDDTEVQWGRFRIDAVRDGRLIEIQHAPLGSIRDKVRTLLKKHEVTVVKPLVRRKLLVKYADQSDLVADRRWSPKCGDWLEIFHELLHFTRVFPHPRLRLELALIDIEEHREPTHRRSRRRFAVPHKVRDQRLLEWIDTRVLRTPADLVGLLPKLPTPPFHTGALGLVLQVDRWVARRIAYCLRECGVLRTVGKERNSWLYEPTEMAVPQADRQLAENGLIQSGRASAGRGRRRKASA